ncbi:MAG TPA: AAA family ATPase [Polyangiaceae bacterium LLY-WYZ-14_1]|nr:AAA family ATPase [Polyangiaceae bacterium LLY-WYZ-14_1]
MTRSAPDRSAELAALGERLVETHISWVVLTRDRAFKVKKPVDFGFLDFTSPERRRQACEEEVRLNRRLAPAVYLGVVPVTRDAGHGGLRFGGVEADAIDWAVEMVRLADARRADQMLDRGAFGVPEVDGVARTLAEFHRQAPTSPEIDALGQPERVAVNVRENFDQTRGLLDEVLGPEEAWEVESWQLRFLEEEASRFRSRVAQGRIRDGHGDLRLDHVYLETGIPGEGRVTVVDGIEFNRRFRYADVAADLAFLSMDLTFHGRADLAERLLATYAAETGDWDLYGLVDFYESYRAYVRGKVELFVATDPEASPEVREGKRRDARRHLLLALASERRRLTPPVVVAVGGVIATGKSSVAARLAARLEAPVVATDRTRKQLLGVPLEASATDHRPDAYSPATTERTYREVLRRASVVVRSGRPVVLDATFSARQQRGEARRLAQELGVPFVFVECRAGRDSLEERLLRRGGPGGSVSDARIDLLDRSLAAFEPVSGDELPAAERAVIHTDRGQGDVPEGWNELVARLLG